MINVTYAITVCNEITEITTLVDFLQPRIKSEDEILIQYDSDSATSQIKDYLNIISQIHKNIRVISFPLNKDFASFKNNLKNNANGIFIFQIDADEMPSEYLVENKVHERIAGYNTLSILPQEEIYCLYHHKQIERQEKQNALYDTI